MEFLDCRVNVNDLNLNIKDLFKILQVTDISPDNPVVYESKQVFRQLEDMSNIRGGYIVYDKVALDLGKGKINIDGITVNPQKQICAYLKDVEKLTVFVCTAGDGFSTYSNKYNQSTNYLKAFIVDALGSLVVEKSAEYLHQKIEKEASVSGLKITNRYSPGYCDWAVEEQKLLFSLLPENPCNISLSESSLMIPIKSISGIIGIGKKVVKRAYSCDHCRKDTCIYSRIKNNNYL